VPTTSVPDPLISVPYDPELKAALAVSKYPSTITPDMIGALRDGLAAEAVPVAELVEGLGIDWQELDIPGADGTTMRGTVFRPANQTGLAAGIVHTHGGGMVVGNRFISSELYLDWVSELGAVVVTFDYRLAPEHPHPAPVEDCYAALLWTAEHADELGIDLNRLAVGGASAGGGLAAAIALMARDRSGPALAAQILMYPMLDDRNDSISARQFRGHGAWDITSNETGWTALLGDSRGGPDVSQYAAPARATDLSNLPPASIDVGSAEVFRDEDVDYAVRIWQAGGQAELHVWPGAFHGFDGQVPHAALSQISRRTRNEWIKRTLGV
jgi:acetyl esterase/lipase